MIKKIHTFLLLFISAFTLQAQIVHTSAISYLQDEYWWGGVVGYGSQMPYIKPVKEFDLAMQNCNNQTVALFVSNKGRYIWSDYPFKFEITNQQINIKSGYEKVEAVQSGKTLRDRKSVV